MAAGDPTLDAFIAHWSRAEASERANAQPFLLGLAQVLGLPLPSNTHADGYSFEFPVRIPTGPGEHTTGFLDLYRRGSFVLEAKQFVAPTAEPTDLQLALGPADRKKSGPVRGSHSWDDAMWKARGQAERYARHLPADEPPAPFLLVAAAVSQGVKRPESPSATFRASRRRSWPSDCASSPPSACFAKPSAPDFRPVWNTT
jgi:hypothetical protein